MRRSVPIHSIVHYPTVGDGTYELAKCTAIIHADFVLQYVQQLNCLSEQKLALLNAVIQTASQKNTVRQSE